MGNANAPVTEALLHEIKDYTSYSPLLESNFADFVKDIDEKHFIDL